MSKKTTASIRKPADITDVPAQEVLDLLGLVDENPPSLETIGTWTPEDRIAVAAWAGREHLVASDNDDILRLPRPAVLDPVTTASSPDPVSDIISSPEEDEALRELDAKLNPPDPRAEQWDVTVEGDPMAWHQFCLNYDAHPLYIELNNFDRRLVALCSFDPTVVLRESINGTEYEGQSFLQNATDHGFTVVRVRHVVSRVDANETALYYEHVVSLDGVMRHDRPGSSRNLYTRERWYRTKRSRQAFDADEYLALAASTSKPSKVRASTYGAVLVDTNLNIDAGWIL